MSDVKRVSFRTVDFLCSHDNYKELKRFLLKQLGIDYVHATRERGASLESWVAEQFVKSNGVVVVDSLDMRMNGEIFSQIVRDCYNYKLKLVIQGDVRSALNVLAELLAARDKLRIESATKIVEDLFPKDVFIHISDGDEL